MNHCPSQMMLRVTVFVSLFTSFVLAAQSTPPAARTSIHLIVFTDYQCPYSASEHDVLDKLAATYGSRLQVVWKQSPMQIHATAELAHRAALAAGRQGKFDEMSTLLYANQAHQSDAELASYAEHLHLDVARFRKDLDSPEVIAQMNADRIESQALGVDSTPVLYLDSKRLTGFQSEATLRHLIEQPAAPVTEASESVTPSVDAKLMQKIADGRTARGVKNAPLTLVEFTDFQCPFCAASVPPLKALLEARGNEVRIVYRALPLDFHPQANLAAEAAFAAGAQGKFWEMHDVLFANQHALSREDLNRYAEQLGLNMSAFRNALETHRFAADIAEDRALGEKAGVTGTPAFFLNGEIVEGARSLPELTAWVDSHAGNAALTNNVADAPSAQNFVVAGDSGKSLVTLTWFSDVRSVSAIAQAKLIRALMARGKGKMQIVFKPFPSAGRPDSEVAAAALIAAQRSGKFWEMYDALAERRDVLDEGKLFTVASSIALNPTSFISSLEAAKAEVISQTEDASRRGILGSPVIFLNRTRVDGLQREAFYTAILDRELASMATVAQR